MRVGTRVRASVGVRASVAVRVRVSPGAHERQRHADRADNHADLGVITG